MVRVNPQVLKHPARTYTGDENIHSHNAQPCTPSASAWCTLSQHRIRAALLAGAASSNTRTHTHP